MGLFGVNPIGRKHVIVAVNKMDLVGYSRDIFGRIKRDYTGFMAKLDIPDVQFIPMSPSPETTWWTRAGPCRGTWARRS